LLALPNEDIAKGDYIMIEDATRDKKLVVQVYDETYLDVRGILEEIVRDEVASASGDGIEHDPLQMKSISYAIRDMRVLKCKIRGSIEGGYFTTSVSWLPSRTSSKIKKVSISELISINGKLGERAIYVGRARDGEAINLYAESFDGQLNIVTGRKGSGKSYFAKLLASKLVEYGAYVIVFDLNDEYAGLAWKRNGEPSEIANKVIRLIPGFTLKFNLKYLGLGTFINILHHILDLPGASLREFIRIWEFLHSQNSLTLQSLYEVIQNVKCNELVRDALISRYYTLADSKLFTDSEEEGLRIEDLIAKMVNGGLIIISLNKVYPLTRRMAVEIILSKITQLLEKNLIPPLFLFAEEAHLYLRETYWDDLITRMRHYGVFTTLITNQPDAIKDSIYRQADNIFLFNFTNDNDLEMVSRTSSTDSETIKSIVRTLPPKSLLALGRAVNNLPIVIQVAPIDLITLGETKLFFSQLQKTISLKVDRENPRYK
ncbi:MAG: ATP-binding protein, partial [Nitrososphaerales archaeon]|nr:ATP-binding protein [Nitrososphaerales archaeon]